MASTANVIEALKYTYGVDHILYLMNEEVSVWNILSRVKKPVGGRGQFLMPILVQNPGVWKGVAEGGAKPTALQPDTTEALFSLEEFVGVYDVTWKLLQDARNSKFAFQQAISMLDEGIRRRIFRNINSDLIDDGRGRLGILPAASNDTTFESRFLPRVEKGMVVDVMDDSDDDTKLADSVTVTAVDPIARTVTLSGAPAGTAAGDYIVIEDTTDISVTTTARHLNGLLGVIDSSNPVTVVGNYGGINRSTAGNEFWKAVELANGGVNRPLTEDLMLQALDGAREKGGGEVTAWLSNLNIIRRYHEMLRADTYYALSTNPGAIGGGLGRKSMNNGGPKGDGSTPYQFGGVDWHAEPYFDANVIIGLDTKHFFIGVGENEVPQAISDVFEGKAQFFTETANTTFEVVFYWQGELISDNPAAGVKIADVAES